jgi:hypothetical protein
VGTTFSFALNTQATVSFKFTQRLPGRKVEQHSPRARACS